MIIKVSFLCKTLSRIRADERLYSIMNSHVILKVFFRSEYVSTLRAAERPFDFCFFECCFVSNCFQFWSNSLIFLQWHHELSDPEASPPLHSDLVLLSLSSGLK